MRVATNELALCKDVSGSGLQQRIPIGCRRKIDHRIQGKDLDMIAMGGIADWRLRAVIAVGPRCIAALQNAFWFNQSKLFLQALTASTSVLITVHPQMLDLMSMSQFLLMLGNITKTIKAAGADVRLDWLRYLITRFEPQDVPQVQMLGFMQSMLAEEILKTPMVKTTAISDAGLTKRSLYELDRSNFTRGTYDRAIECMDAVNFEIQGLIHRAWGRM